MAALVAAASAAASAASAEAAAAAAAADSGGIEDFESLLNDLAWAANGDGSSAAGGAGMPMNLEDAHLFAGGGARLPLCSSDSSKVAPCGILKRMTLKNWLNHKRFDIQFNPNVNFISGKNGSQRIVTS
jgi:opacity protein-like surface antigen